jgi:hypothetical protein
MIRSILAVLGGAVLTFVVIWLLEMAGMLIYPPPPGLDFSKPEAVRAAMASIPVGALVCVIVAQSVGTFAGAWFAAYIARRRPGLHAAIVGVLAMLAAIGNMLSIPHPVWFWIVSLLLFLPAAVAGGRLMRRAAQEPPLVAQ